MQESERETEKSTLFHLKNMHIANRKNRPTSRKRVCETENKSKDRWV